MIQNTSLLSRYPEVSYTSLQLLLNKYGTLFSEGSPKGFGKFFGGGSSKPQKSNDKEKSSSSSSSEPSGKSEPPPGSNKKPDDEDVDILKKIKAEYKSFDQLSGGGPGGKKTSGGGIPNPDRERWFTFGMIGSAIAIAAISYYGYSYQEINWKDLTR